MADTDPLSSDSPEGGTNPAQREEEQEGEMRRGPTLLERRFTHRVPGGRLEFTFSAGPMLGGAAAPHGPFIRFPAPPTDPMPDFPIPPQTNLSPVMESGNENLQNIQNLLNHGSEAHIIGPQSPLERPAGLATPLASPGFSAMLEYLLGIRGGPMVPMPWQSAEWERLVQESMADTGGVKRVASAEGLEEVKVFEYSKSSRGSTTPTSPKEEMCAITQMPFEEGDLVADMPCGHRFDKECLFRWLETESAACPVCRKEVASREVSANASVATEVEATEQSGTVGQAELSGEAEEGDQAVIFPRITLRRNGIVDARAAERVALERLYELERQREDDILEAAMVAAVMQMSIDDV
jgi:hypothetical protein